MRHSTEQTDKLEDEVATDIAIRYQKAIVSSVLHGYFLIEPFTVRQPLDHLPVLLNGVGLEVPDKKSSEILSLMEKSDLARLSWLIEEACTGRRWLSRRDGKRRYIARQFFEMWRTLEADELTDQDS